MCFFFTDGSYGPQCRYQCQCENNALCSFSTGECFCKPGWMGRVCNESCLAGTFGMNCSEQCTCMNGATCDNVNGICYCTAGWAGINCTKKCPTGKSIHLISGLSYILVWWVCIFWWVIWNTTSQRFDLQLLAVLSSEKIVHYIMIIVRQGIGTLAYE